MRVPAARMALALTLTLILALARGLSVADGRAAGAAVPRPLLRPLLLAGSAAALSSREVAPGAGGGARPACPVVNGRLPVFAEVLTACSADCSGGAGASCPCCEFRLPGRNQGLLCNRANCCVRVILSATAAAASTDGSPLVVSFEPLRTLGVKPDATCTDVMTNATTCPQTCAVVLDAAGQVQDCGDRLVLPSYNSDLAATGSCRDVGAKPRDSPTAQGSPDLGPAQGSTTPKIIGFVIGMIALLAAACAIILAIIFMFDRQCRKRPPSRDETYSESGEERESASFPTFPSAAATAGGGGGPIPSQTNASVDAPSMRQAGGPYSAVAVGMHSTPTGAHIAGAHRSRTAEPFENPVVPVAIAHGQAPYPSEDAAARIGPKVMTSRSSAAGAIQQDDMDGISVVELDDTAGERSDGGETIGGSQVIPTELLHPRNGLETVAYGQQADVSVNAPQREGDRGRLGDLGGQGASGGASESRLFKSNSSIISMERTENSKA
jgi:hypothetical protein